MKQYSLQYETCVKHADLTSIFWEKKDKYTEILKKYMESLQRTMKSQQNNYLLLNVKKAIKFQPIKNK